MVDVQPAGNDPLRHLFDHQYQSMVSLATALMGNRAQAEEVVQEAFLRVGPRLPAIGDGSAVAYLRTAVMNQARSELRRGRAAKRRAVPLRMVADGPEDEAVRSDERRRVLAALDRLPVRQRQCLVLRFYAGLSDPEVAATLEISVGSAKTHIRRGLESLRATEVAP